MALVPVTFEWDDQYGECYDCGLPAAYRTINYGRPDWSDTVEDHELRCSVCAASDASRGEHIQHLFFEED